MHTEKAGALGVGIAIQGLVSSDGQSITYSAIWDCAGTLIDDICRFINYPCQLIHDSEAAAFAELWFSKNIKNAVYLFQSKNLGGAVIINATLHKDCMVYCVCESMVTKIA